MPDFVFLLPILAFVILAFWVAATKHWLWSVPVVALSVLPLWILLQYIKADGWSDDMNYWLVPSTWAALAGNSALAAGGIYKALNK